MQSSSSTPDSENNFYMSLALCKDIVMLEQKSTEFSGMSLYGVALRLVFTGVTGMAKPGMVVSTYF